MIKFEIKAWQDIGWWAIHEPIMVKKIWELVNDISKHPFEGLGKPESLKGNLKGYWSRRIDQEHRIVYRVRPEEIIIVSAKGHYQ